MKNNSLTQPTHRVSSLGFISTPGWFDPSPYDFTTAVEESVITQQAFPLLPAFDYSLDSIASEQLAERACLCAQSLRAAGCRFIVQVGSPFAWANVVSEAQARQRLNRIAETVNIPSTMTSLAIVDALRSCQVKKIGITSTYYSSAWNRHFATFMSLCGFEVLHSSNFYQQGLVSLKKEGEHFRYANCTADDMADMVKASVQSVQKETLNCEAIVIVGTGARTIDTLRELESVAQCPVIPADTVVYWLAARHLNLTLSPKMGCFRDLPY